jgi:cyclohexyl-isocyanide hydratase
MTHDRRDFLRTMGAASLAVSAVVEARATKPKTTKPAHDMSGVPASWHGKEQIAMLLYPGFTALDLVGPQYMLGNLMGAKVHLVARTLAPVMSDTGLAIAPTVTLARTPKVLDILFVPGGSAGTVNAMKDKALVQWIADRGSRAKLIASVCTGSLVLGQAGLLRGKRATSHWVTLPLLGEFGAEPIDTRVVWDGNVVTGAGVSAGLDLGLSIVARLRDETYAQSVQLLAEYAPQPPFNAGTPATAPEPVHKMMSSMFDNMIEQMRIVSRDALPGRRPV